MDDRLSFWGTTIYEEDPAQLPDLAVRSSMAHVWSIGGLMENGDGVHTYGSRPVLQETSVFHPNNTLNFS